MKKSQTRKHQQQLEKEMFGPEPRVRPAPRPRSVVPPEQDMPSPATRDANTLFVEMFDLRPEHEEKCSDGHTVWNPDYSVEVLPNQVLVATEDQRIALRFRGPRREQDALDCVRFLLSTKVL